MVANPESKIAPLMVFFLLLPVMLLSLPDAAATESGTGNVGTIVLSEAGSNNGSPSSIAVNHETNLVYVVNLNSDTVSVINATTNTLAETISVGFGPTDVAVNSDTNLVYVVNTANSPFVTVLNGTSNKILKTIAIGDRSNIYNVGGIAVNEKTNKIYILLEIAAEPLPYASIAVIDGLSHSMGQIFTVARLGFDIDVPERVRDISVNSKANLIFVVLSFGDLYVIDGASNRVFPKISIGYDKAPNRVEVNEETGIVYVSNFNNQSISVIDISKYEIIKTVQVGYDPQGIAIDDMTNTIYVVSLAGHVSLINGSSHELTRIISVEQFPVEIAFNKNNGLAYVSNTGSNSVSVIDASVLQQEWHTAYAVGRFLNSEPPRPDQIFKIQHRVMNGTLETFDIRQEVQDVLIGNWVVAKVNSNGTGILEIKFPRNFPYTSSQGGIENFIFNIGNRFDEEARRISTDCLFVLSIPFMGSAEIEMIIPTILMKAPYHGDDIPASCISQTVIENVPTRPDGTIAPLHQLEAGVAAEDVMCPREGEKFMLLISPKSKPYCAHLSNEGFLKAKGWTTPE